MKIKVEKATSFLQISIKLSYMCSYIFNLFIWKNVYQIMRDNNSYTAYTTNMSGSIGIVIGPF